jgi:SAM-dependent methyltransferase
MLFREVIFLSRALLKVGKGRLCPVCGWQCSRFLSTGIESRRDARCPRCNSHERHRAIWLYLKEKTDLFNTEKKKLLHVAPEFCFTRKLKGVTTIDYLSVDLGYGLAQMSQDITQLHFPDLTFDCFITLHVLEHIRDDHGALKELFRVLKHGGWGIIQVPVDLSMEKTKEDLSADTPEKRLSAFGQDDHVRLYGKDLKQKIEKAGFGVEYCDMWKELSEGDRERYRIAQGEPFYCVRKPFCL